MWNPVGVRRGGLNLSGCHAAGAGSFRLRTMFVMLTANIGVAEYREYA